MVQRKSKKRLSSSKATAAKNKAALAQQQKDEVKARRLEAKAAAAAEQAEEEEEEDPEEEQEQQEESGEEAEDPRNQFEDSSADEDDEEGDEGEGEQEQDGDALESDSDDAMDSDDPDTQQAKRLDLKVKETSTGFTPDLGHVAAFNVIPLDPSLFSGDKATRERTLSELASGNVQLLLRDLMALEGEHGSNIIKQLPKADFRLPRHKAIPKPKPPTRWEKFAKEKDIENTKRDRMVWSDETQTWAPRYGMGRHNDDKEWLKEVNENDGGEVDKFQEAREKKKVRVLKNRAKYVRNKSEAEQARSEAVHAVSNLDIAGARSGASKQGKAKLASSLKDAQTSTASLGRFDRNLAGEPKRKLTNSKKRKFTPSLSTDDVERNRNILNRLLGKHTAPGPAAVEPKKKSTKKQKQKQAKLAAKDKDRNGKPKKSPLDEGPRKKRKHMAPRKTHGAQA